MLINCTSFEVAKKNRGGTILRCRYSIFFIIAVISLMLAGCSFGGLLGMVADENKSWETSVFNGENTRLKVDLPFNLDADEFSKEKLSTLESETINSKRKLVATQDDITVKVINIAMAVDLSYFGTSDLLKMCADSDMEEIRNANYISRFEIIKDEEKMINNNLARVIYFKYKYKGTVGLSKVVYMTKSNDVWILGFESIADDDRSAQNTDRAIQSIVLE